jgi:hypothetical protein
MNRTIRNILFFFASAVLFGLLEGGGHVTFGPPTLFGLLVANWHLPMAGLLLILAIGLDTVVFIPLWVLLEDMAYWIFSGHELATSSWISMSLGGFYLFGIYLPWTYVLLVGLWGVFLLVRFSYRIVAIKFEI